MGLRKIGRILLYASAAAATLLLLLLLAGAVALDRAPHYQAQIKEWVRQRIGYPIAFAHIAPALRWYGPELYFARVELRSKDDQRVLARAAGGRVGVDLWQLIRGGKSYAVRIELDSPEIAVTRVSPDRFALASEVEFGGGAAPLPALRLEDLPAVTLAVRHGAVTLERWNPSLPQLQMREVDLRLSRRERVAALKLDAKLPAELGGSVSVDGSAQGAGTVDSLEWTVLARTRALSLAGLHQLLPDTLRGVGSGTGAFDVTARGRGQSVSRADLTFDAEHVTSQLDGEAGLQFDQVAGALTLTHTGDRWTLLGRRMRALRAGRRDPDSDFDVSWRGAAGLLDLHARASYVRVENLLPLAGWLPQQELRERLQDLAPSGECLDLKLDLARAGAGGPLAFNLQARFRGVGFAPVGRAPGLRGLNGTLAGNQNGGRVDVETQQGVFSWPSQFSQPVEVANLKTTLYWKRSPDELLVATPSFEIATRDASLQGRMAWREPADGSSPVLTLASTVADGNVANTRLYLPKLLISPAAFMWLDRAFVAGHLSRADVVIQGPIRHYPFRDGSGLFLARAHVDGLTLDYKDGWPVVENLSVLAEFRNEGMSVQFTGGQMDRLQVQSADARFVDFKSAELTVHAALSGDAGDALQYLRATPLDALAGRAFSKVDAHGPLSADVDLFLPFKEFDHRHTVVHAHLQGVSLNRNGSPVAATELAGDADVDGAWVSRADVHGKLLGGAFTMQARAPRNRPVTRTILVFNGTLSGDALHAALSLPATLPIGGSTDWHGVLHLTPEPARERSFRVNGSLAGLDLMLPEPLAKPVGRPLPSSVEIEWPDAGDPQVSLVLGSVLRGRLSLDAADAGAGVGRAAVTFGAGASSLPPPFSESQVVNTGGTIERLDLGGWLKAFTPDKNGKPLGSLLRSATFEIAQIDYLGLSFLDVGLDLAATESGWRIGLSGPNVVGSIAMAGAADPGEPWSLEFQRLKFVDGPGRSSPGLDRAAAGQPANGGTGPDGGGNPRAVPAMAFHAAELIWGDRHFGDVRAMLTKLDDGISLKQLTVSAANFAATVNGEWRGPDAGVARVEGTLSSTDVGATLKDLGYAAVIEAKTGRLDVDLSWVGAPTGEALSNATGHVDAAFDDGQLTGIKPGAGRVLGLASLTALPRRLSLDFSDLTDKGLAFDTIRGDFDLRDGSAFTDDVVVKGPAADIGLIGRVGLKNKDYDQTVEVTGNVSSTLPLAAFVAGPVVGGAVLLFSQVFEQPLKGLARGYYRITGSWENPTVERIKSADAAAATAEASK